MFDAIPNNDYILLTPGPLSTSKRVRAALLKDSCTWDAEYNNVVEGIRDELLNIAKCSKEKYTSVLMQGSGSFSVESVIGTELKETDKLLVLVNGAYGKRIKDMADVLKINNIALVSRENEILDAQRLENLLKFDSDITHVAMVHCETTTGILNDLESIGKIVKKHKKIFIVDAMSSLGGIDIDVEKLNIDYIISSSNKCIQGVPGFAFVIARRVMIERTKGNAKSHALDLYGQWETMEKNSGKWRFTSATHTVHAFNEALKELKEEGGVIARAKRYRDMQKFLVNEMEKLGFDAYINKDLQSPIITTFCYLKNVAFEFNEFYGFLKKRGFVIYPGKLSDRDTFRIGNIGDIKLGDIERLISIAEEYVGSLEKIKVG